MAAQNLRAQENERKLQADLTRLTQQMVELQAPAGSKLYSPSPQEMEDRIEFQKKIIALKEEVRVLKDKEADKAKANRFAITDPKAVKKKKKPLPIPGPNTKRATEIPETKKKEHVRNKSGQLSALDKRKYLGTCARVSARVTRVASLCLLDCGVGLCWRVHARKEERGCC